MKYSLLSLLLLITVFSIAQGNGKIAGRIISKNENTVQGVTVSLLRAVDSFTVKQTLSNKEGLYHFEAVVYGRYLISITAVGHQKVLSKIFEINAVQMAVMVPALPLIPLNQSMAGVTVTAKRPLIEQKIDRTIVNPEAIVSNTGVSALEVLENAPGVTVDKEGTISLKGKDGVIILVDGRPTQLAGADLVNLLRSMNSNQIDQVEIMTNPPAKYDASGTAGLINIKTKKTLTAGYNGTASVAFTQGRYPKTNESFNFNYRNAKINWFTNLAHTYNANFGTLTIQRKIFNNTGDAIENYFDQTGHKISEGNAYNGKMGLDYFVSKKTTLGLVVNGLTGASNTGNKTVTNIFNTSKELEQKVNALVDNTNGWTNLGANVNFRTLLNTKGRELTSDLDFISYRSGNSQIMVNSYFERNGNASLKADSLLGTLPQDITLYSGRADYTHPLKKGARLEAGIKSSFVETDNDAVYDSIEYGNRARDINRSNHFVYEEIINAAYVNLNQSLSKKLGVQLGLRMEHTNAKGRQLTSGDNFARNYTQLFPTAYFQFKANEKNTLLFNYGRRIRRPNYQSLNPFIRFIDRYTYSSGNPNLKPQLSDNIEFTHSWRNRINTTINYSYTSDIMDDVIQQQGQEAFKTPANIASHRQFGLAINANTPVTKWWISVISVNAFSNRYKGVIGGRPIQLEARSYLLNAVQQLKLSKTLTAEINGRYRNGWYEGTVKASPVGFIGAGLSKQLMKNKVTLRLAVRDAFFTQKFRGESRYGNVDINYQEIRDTRNISVGCTYRFSKGKKITPAKRTMGGASEEQERFSNE